MTATIEEDGGTRLARNLCSGSAATDATTFGIWAAVDAVAARRAVIACTARCRRSRRLLAAAGLILFNSLSGACQMIILLYALLA